MTYCRVYHSIITDAKFADVYTDDRRLALWLRLLIGADQAWPTPAVLPRSANDAALRHLVDVGLVERVGRDHYRICGMDAERNARRTAGRNAASMRWQSGGDAETMPTRAEPSRAKPSQVSAKRTRCPVDPEHDTILADGKVRCLVCRKAVA